MYASAAGAHQLVVLDDRDFGVLARVDGIRFPDGIAYASAVKKVFVSDESGEADVVVDGATSQKRTVIALCGEAGNTHYDSISGCVLVAVQSTNEIVAIDPALETIVSRYAVPGVGLPAS